MTELERRALLGDQEAQRECTEKGIAIACPFCGGLSEIHTVEGIPEYTENKSDIPSGSRIMCQVIRESGSSYYEYRRKLYVPRCCNSKCCGRTTKRYDTKEIALSEWNTCPAPPIGRCGECNEYDTENCSKGCGWCQVWDIGRFDDGFCDKFKSKERKENAVD